MFRDVIKIIFEHYFKDMFKLKSVFDLKDFVYKTFRGKILFSYFKEKYMREPDPYDYDEDSFEEAEIYNKNIRNWSDEDWDKFYDYYKNEYQEWEDEMTKKGWIVDEWTNDYDGTLFIAYKNKEVQNDIEILTSVLKKYLDLKDPYQ